MPVHVRYRAQLVLDSEGFFTIPDKEPTNVTLGDIKAHWPFQGNFHFRWVLRVWVQRGCVWCGVGVGAAFVLVVTYVLLPACTTE